MGKDMYMDKIRPGLRSNGSGEIGIFRQRMMIVEVDQNPTDIQLFPTFKEF